MTKTVYGVIIVLLVMGFVGGTVAIAQDDAKGTLEFRANGEDFTRLGFTSKDGWEITVDHFYINMADITAYQTDPPFDGLEADTFSVVSSVSLGEELYWVDLAEGDEEAEPILVDSIEASVGRYNALSWAMLPVEDEENEFSGYSIVLIGTATRDDVTLTFTIKAENEYNYLCGEYVGEQRKGILQTDSTADMEMTFHIDHIFGDGELPMDDDLNIAAPGFDVFASFADEAGVVEVDFAILEESLPEDVFNVIYDIFPTLGHVGEGHCLELLTHAETNEEDTIQATEEPDSAQ